MSLRERIRRRLRKPQAATVPYRPPLPRPPLSAYRLADPGLASITAADLHPDLRAALDTGRPASVLDEVHPEIFTAPIVSDDWLARLRAELDALDAWAAQTGCRIEPPNSMNRYGVILDEIGLSAALRELMLLAIRPLAAHAFPEVGGSSLDDHHGFIVEYQRGGDRDLGFHVDDSEVTLNLSLGPGFSGGELYFEGRRCAEHRQTGCSSDDRFHWGHQAGVGLLHAGKHRHGALSTLSGRRRNLILWCRSTAHRDTHNPEICPEWCQRSRAR